MAGDVMHWSGSCVEGHFAVLASFSCIWTPRVEAASGGDVHRAWNVAAEQSGGFLVLRIWNGNGFHEEVAVWMLRVLVEYVTFRILY